MKIRNASSATLLIAAMLIAVLMVSLGCRPKGKSESQSEMTTEKTTTYGKIVEKAKETTAALANPEKGIDPVCGMTKGINC